MTKHAIKRLAAAVVCIKDGKLLTVNLEDPTTKVQRLFLPGGKIEQGESPEEAARRETLEETGYHVKVDPSKHRSLSHFFTWDAQLYDRRTEIFRAVIISDVVQSVNDAPYHRGVVWLPLSSVRDQFSYADKMADCIEYLTSSKKD